MCCDHITNKLQEAEVLLSQGSTVGKASKRIEVTEQTYYRWRREYGGMRVDQARRLKELEKENSQLKKLVVDLSLDNAILKEAVSHKYVARGLHGHGWASSDLELPPGVG